MKSGYRVMFLRDNKGQPVGCLAIQLTRGRKSAKYQVSTLNPIDKFDRGLARQIALGRLVENSFTVALNGAADVHKISTVVMQHLSYNKSVPARAARAARRWLNNDPPRRVASAVEW